MIREYYQIGGFEPHIDWPQYRYDDKKMAQIIAGDASPLKSRGKDSNKPIELVLGITRIGTSHLLLTEQQLAEVVRAFHMPYPRKPSAKSTDFESLSPIYFNNTDEFAEKFGALKIKSTKNRARTDNSQTNKQFVSGVDGVQRGGFEHGRLLYRILQNHVVPEVYSLDDISWKPLIHVHSFVFTPRSNDTRLSSDRRKYPIALDCGMAEATIPDIQVRAESPIHFYFTNNRYIANSKKLAFQHGVTEELDGTVIATRLRDFFQDRKGLTSEPIILLVYDEEVSKNMLTNCGIDTSSWESGIKGLLGFEVPLQRAHGPSRVQDPRRQQHAGRDPRRDEYDQRRARPRSRSRSPNRTSDHRSYPSSSRPLSYGDSSRRSPSRPYLGTSGSSDHHRRSYAPVYVVDIKEQFSKLMQTATSSDSIAKISQYLGLSDMDGWCAGNESVMIIDIWRSMISGLSIDEQRALREKSRDPKLQAANAPPLIEGGATEYDSDRDPNDIVQVEQPASYDDDSDYGQSSDSD